MNYFSCLLLFLGPLSIINFLTLVSLYILDFTSVASKQKIIFIRIGLIIMSGATLIFYILQFFSFHTIAFVLPDKIINQFQINSLPIKISQHNDWAFYLFIIYVTGFFVMLFRIVFSYLKSNIQLAHSNACRMQGYDVLLSNNIQSPLSFGLLKPKIYLPYDMKEKWSKREIEMCLAHEQIHIDQNDTFWKLLSLIVVALLYFAPWVYFLHRKFELEMEIFCDEKTCYQADANFQEYGSLLLAMTPIQSNNFIFTNIKTSTLKRRIIAMKSKTIRRPLLVSMLSVVLLLCGGTVIATSDGILAKKSTYKITSKIFVDGQLVSSPQIVAVANQKAAINLSKKNADQSLQLTVIANDIAKDNIKVNYDIEYHDGNEKMHSKPEMIFIPNQEGIIRIASDLNHTFEMKVVVERQ